MNNLVDNLTQKDEAKAIHAARVLIDTKNLDAFKKLCEKSEFLFDFVKDNVRKRLKTAIKQENFHNIITFFNFYCEEYADTLIEALSHFADEDLSDKIFELLENGTIDEKKYAALYFCYIPDTIAQEALEKLSFDNDIQLAVNCARALGAMNSTGAFEKALNLLDSEDDFELIKAVRFLSAFGDKSAIPHLLEVLETSPAAENIAGEIPFLSSIQNMLKTHDKNSVLNCFDLILTGLGEIYPLNDLFFFEVYNVLQYLIEQQKHNAPDSHIAAILLRAYEKFSSIHDCDEYLFDESKDVKNEIKDIFDLLNSQQKEFWTQQKEIIPNELKQSKFRSISALDIIRLMEITSAKNDVINFINSVRDEQSILAGLGAAKSLDILNKLDKEELKSKIANPTLSEVLESFFV